MPLPVRLLIATAQPTTTHVAVLGVICFTALLLTLAAFRARRLEINYAAD